MPALKMFTLIIPLLFYAFSIVSTQEIPKENDVYQYVPNDNPTPSKGLLYPIESESRELRSLDGVWDFIKSNVTYPWQGVDERWFQDELNKVATTIPMPVPASYNDVTTDKHLRDHVGTVWYERKFFVPKSWNWKQRVWLRFGSVHYAAIVWLNGINVMQHKIGHLPFEAEITSLLKFGAENRLTVLCDNTLTNTTVPQGHVQNLPSESGTKLVQTYTFDFFNYAGIHRSVHLYTTPMVYIEDVMLTTDLQDNNTGHVNYQITASGQLRSGNYLPESTPLYVHLQLRNKAGEIVAHHLAHGDLRGTLAVQNVVPWWPYLMHSEPGYLYKLEIYLHAGDSNKLLDVYRMNVGIRSLRWTDTNLLINEKPVYLHGFGKHEDSDFRGKGLDFALLTRDFNLLKWIGANAYRTSHYPYSEESMQFADKHGIMIIDECPSVNTDIFEPELLKNHKSSLEQLIHRDRNHASVIMWSVANEPRTAKKEAELYFSELTAYTRTLDNKRPLTASTNVDHLKDKMVQFLDIVSFNRYNAWYANGGLLETITLNVTIEALAWRSMYNKPVLMSEYGADTYEGLHFLPEYIWSEDYQTALFSKHFQAFDGLRHLGWFIGEFVWNFADFKTEQSYTRVGGNKKGVFTRNRQPKASAYLLRQRYFSLANELYQCQTPDDLYNYVINSPHKSALTHDFSAL